MGCEKFHKKRSNHISRHRERERGREKEKERKREREGDKVNKYVIN